MTFVIYLASECTKLKFFISECQDYKMYSYVWERAPIGNNQLVKVLRCPFGSNPVIIGGEDASIGEFPHLVRNVCINKEESVHGN